MIQIFWILSLLVASGMSLATTPVRVLTYNVYAKPDLTESLFTEERMNALCERIRTGPWDIVLLQEVWTKNHRARLSKCGLGHIMDLRSTGSSKREKNLGSGLMILSRFPLEDQERKILVRPRGLKAIFAHGERIVSKSVYVARARMPNGKSFWVANTHFVSNYCETSNFESCSSYQNVRYSQLTQASTFLRERTGDEAVIFGGDLNFGPHPTSNDRSWKEFEKFFPGFLQATYHDNASCTSCSSNSFKANHTDGGKIDHIYVSPNLTARDGALVFTDMMTTRQGLETHISDHYGWETTVDIP